MSHRTQITLTDEQYARLRAESRRTGLSLAELVRRALEQTYADADIDKFVEALERTFGLWKDRDVDGEAYVERLRPGMERRLAGKRTG